jgi:hypothetical protein
MLRLTTAGHVPHNALEFRSAETTSSVPHLQAHLEAAPVEQFPENHDIIERSVYQVADRANGNVHSDSIPAQMLTLKPI